MEIRLAAAADGLPLPPGARAEAGAGSARITLRGTSQAELHNFLNELRDRNLPLVSVSQSQPDLEEIFLRLTGQDSAGARTRPASEERVA